MIPAGNAEAPPLPTELLEFWAHQHPAHTIYTHLKFDGSAPICIRYDEIYRRSLAIAADLNARGLRGRPVLLVHPSGPEFISAFFGTLLAGAIATPLPVPRFESQYQRLEGVIADCVAGALLSTNSVLEGLERRLPVDSPLRACAWLTGCDEAGPGLMKLDPPKGDDIAVLQYTSGSTSRPRGVKVTHANLAHNLATITREFRPSPDARLLSWLPHFHDMGLIGGLLSPLTWGGESILMSPQSFLQRPLRWLQAISEYGAEVSGAPNFAYELCVKAADRGGVPASLDLASWNIAFVGAEPIRAATLSRFVACFASRGFRKSALLPCYGLAEATLLVTCKRARTEPSSYRLSRESLESGHAVCSDHTHALELVGCGHPAGATEVQIVDPGSGELLGPGRVGELWVSGPQIARGYWNHPETSAFEATLPGCRENARPEKKFLRTGDLGFLTQEGEFVFVERCKDLIVVNGQNYACHDLENTAAASYACLSPDGCAMALVDTDYGPHLIAMVEFHMDALDRTEQAAQAIRGALFTVHGLAVRTIAFLAPGKLSRTTSGKLQRRQSLKHLAAGSTRRLALHGDPIPDFTVPTQDFQVL